MMERLATPAAEGVSGGNTVLDAAGFVRKYPLETGTALADLSTEYAFFTPAVLYLYGRFTDAPLADHVHATGVRFFYKTFARPLFRGLEAPSNGDPTWNRALWAVRRDAWDAFVAFLLSVTLYNEAEKHVYGVGQSVLSVPDPLAAHHGVVEVSAFGVNGSKFRAGLAPPRLAVDLPRLVRIAPDPKMVAFAAAWFGGSNPVDAAGVGPTGGDG